MDLNGRSSLLFLQNDASKFCNTTKEENISALRSSACNRRSNRHHQDSLWALPTASTEGQGAGEVRSMGCICTRDLFNPGQVRGTHIRHMCMKLASTLPVLRLLDGGAEEPSGTLYNPALFMCMKLGGHG